MPNPVIMATTEGGQDAVNKAMALGASGYVTKPFSADKLSEVLGRVLG